MSRTPPSQDGPAAWVNSAFVANRGGAFEIAEKLCRRALRLAPALPEAHFNLGRALRGLGRAREARDALRRAAALTPNSAPAQNEIGLELHGLGEWRMAEECFRRAVTADDKLAVAHHNLGNLMQSLGRFTEAEESYRRALVLEPSLAASRNGLGALMSVLGRLSEAESCYRQALETAPDDVETRVNLGNLLSRLGRYEEADEAYRQALRTAPEDAGARYHRGLLHLLLGRFESGWADYECRRAATAKVQRQRFSAPDWDGLPLPAGATLLVHCEQGAGDSIQFVRYLPQVKQRAGCEVVLECPASLTRLFARLDGVDRVVVQGGRLPAHSAQIPLLSLPLKFRTTLATIPAPVPYLGAQPRADLRRNGRLHVGIVWAGNPDFRFDAQRSVEFGCMRRWLEEMDSVQWVIFQLQRRPDDLPELVRQRGWIDPFAGHADAPDYADTAAVVAGLDLVIGVDTSVIHLAGAMGVAVWALIPSSPDWRWMLQREDSPWYPTMRLFRQGTPGDWASVLEEVGKELLALARDSPLSTHAPRRSAS